MTTVVNRYKVDIGDSDVVYIGRGSIWGNDSQMKDKSDIERQRVIQEYRRQLWSMIKSGRVTKEMILSLDGKRLACYCSPKPCHGDILIEAISWAKRGIDKST